MIFKKCLDCQQGIERKSNDFIQLKTLKRFVCVRIID